MHERQSKNDRVLVWVGVVALFSGLYLMATWQVPPGTLSGSMSAYASQGEVIAQFPKALFLDNAVAVEQDYSINYSASENQYTAQWNSEDAPEVVLNEYQNYFTSAGWAISAGSTGDPNVQQLSASASTGYALVTVAPQGVGSQVTVVYVATQQ